MEERLIRRDELYKMYRYSQYLNECCSSIILVFDTVIEFKKGPLQMQLKWSVILSKAEADEVLEGINEICNTNFKFID